ncbi:MAG: helix-turn-helix transcriptional regulator [Allosphingosinicella sp.]|uniref:helix-turn-helix domain-containing protein n=1 Tax=Allosphingosinicella sp. TaxID=2823234 RepID=UPI00394FB99C
MGPERIAKLNEGQRTCLRMVLAHMSSKDIARELGISHHTVDKRIKTAMQTLGAESRVDAARMLAAHEDGHGYQPLVYQAPDVAEPGDGAAIPVSFDDEGAEDRAGHEGRWGQSAADAAGRPNGRTVPLPFPTGRGERNTLSIPARLGWIVAIAIGSALSFGAVLAGLDALSRLI